MTTPTSKPLSDSELACVGEEMHAWASDLFPICRSLTGEGVRQTLACLGKLLPDLTIHEVTSGTQAFDWTVPDEWNVSEAYIENSNGERVLDFADHNLHLMGYSEPVDIELDWEDLDKHLYSLPDQPDLIPYTTSYYKRRWGFCLTHRQREAMPAGRYRAVVRSTLQAGSLTYGELILPGTSTDEVLLSTYICHPSMANNELSGPVVTTALVRWLASLPERRLTYRIVFIPETIGSLVYLSRNLATMKERTVAGFVITCVGDERSYSMLGSRLGATKADRVAAHVLDHAVEKWMAYSFHERGSDERQYCAPGVDLPVVSVMRSKYGTYPEYHTSADDLSLITPAGLAGSLRVLSQCLQVLEADGRYRVTTLGEPQLGKRALYPTLSAKGSADAVRDMMNLIAYADGTRDLVGLAEAAKVPAIDAIAIVRKLIEHGLFENMG
ncbi:MAG: DUF4910 domain-containing protein [Filomicrobium sp.]